MSVLRPGMTQLLILLMVASFMAELRYPKLVAIGACACTGMPSAQRNAFPAELKDKIKFLLDRFNQGEKVKKQNSKK